MTTELQSRCWQCLPKEAREWLRKEYQAMLNKQWCCNAYLRGRLRIMREIYGEHNLTSDTEPEEMLMVEKKRVQEVYDTSKDIISNEAYGSKMYSMHLQIVCVLESLFGESACPTKEQPKYKIGDKVRIKGQTEVKEVYRILPDGRIMFGNKGNTYSVDDLEPYTEENKEPIPQTNVGICDNCQTRTLSDEELDALIYRLKNVRDKRKKLTRDLSDILEEITAPRIPG